MNYFKRINLNKKTHLIGFATALIILLSVIAFLYYKNKEKNIKDNEFKTLKMISDLKIKQIADWYSDETNDASIISNNTMLSERIWNWKESKSFSDSITLAKFLTELRLEHGYEHISLFFNNKTLFNSEFNEELHEPIANFVQRSLKTKSVICTDLFRCMVHNKTHIIFISPVLESSGESIAVLILYMNPESVLYPIISTWPTPNKTAETLLLRKEQNSILYLNELKKRKDAALKLKIPLSRKDNPGVMAASGYKGIFEGKDYNENEVISYVNIIPGTPWFMVVKVNKNEIFQDIYYEALIVIFFSLLIIICTILGLSFIYSFRQNNIYKKLLETQEEFSTTLYSIGEAVITTDSKGIIKYLNNAAQSLTGWNESEAKGKKLSLVFNIINEDTRKPVENPVSKVLREGRVISLSNHLILISKDGREIPIADSGAPIKNESDEIIGVVLVFRDQTDERLKKKLLRESEEKYRLLTENSSDAVWMMPIENIGTLRNPEHKRILNYYSPSILKLTGFTPEEACYRTVYENVTADSALLIQDFVKKELQKSEKDRWQNSTLDLEVYRKDGSTFLAEISIMPVINKGKLTHLQGYLRDITERKIAEKQLYESELKFRTVVTHSTPIIFMTDKYGKFLLSEGKMLTSLGLKPGEVVGYSAMEIYQDYPQILNGINSALSGEHYEDIIEVNGIIFDIFYTPYKNSAGEITGVIGMASDITERKKIEKALLESEEIFRSFLEHSPVYIFFKDENIRSVKLSRNFEEMIGKPINELIGKTMDELFPSDFAKSMIEDDKRIFKQGEQVIVDEELNGRYYTTIKFPVHINDKIKYLAGFTIDITEKKKAEAYLKKSEDDLKKAQSVAHVGSWSWDIKNNKVTWSDEMYSLFGINKEFFTGKLDDIILQTIHPEDLPSVAESNKSVIDHKKPVPLEYRIILPDHTIRYVWAEAGELIDDANGNPAFLSGIVQDITERKITLETIRQSEERFRKVFEEGQLGIVMTDPQFNFISVNDTFARMTGFKKEELLKLKWTDITHPDNVDADVQKVQNLLNGKTEAYHTEKKYIRNGGEIIWGYVTVSLIHNHKGEVAYILAMINEITERKEAEEKIREALREKETLLRELYHRTKNNMHVIVSMLALQAASHPDSKASEFVEAVEPKIHAMALVHQMLYQSRDLSHIDLKDYITRLCELTMKSYNISPEKIELELCIESALLLIDSALPCGLVINELLSNAFKHAFPNNGKGKISIHLSRKENGSIELKFSDNGIGIPAGFDLRNQPTLGFQTIFALVEEQLKGVIKVESNNGMQFTIHFTDDLYTARI